jgi:TolB-like protein/Flp pilus assembly protein TadD
MAAGSFFVSYASQDAAVANSIVESLEQQGLRCWLAPRDVKPGAPYADAIVRAINEASAVVLVLSASAVGSAHVGREVERAASKHKQIIGFRLDTAPLNPELEYFLSNSQWIDVPAIGMPAALAKLTEAVGRGSGQTVAANPGASTRPEKLTPASTKLIAGAAVVAIVSGSAALAVHFWSQGHKAPQPAAAVAITDKSIAVLPFVDMSEKHDQEYFADGLAEEVLSLLATLPDLKVISRTSSFQFKGQNADLRTVGAQLGAAYLVEGSVRRYGDRVRVTAQLISTHDGVHRWSDSYEGDVGDVLRMQQDIAAALGRSLQVEVRGGVPWQAATTVTSMEAYASYLHGLHSMDRNDRTGYEEAVSYFERALALDPSHIRARERLGQAHFLQFIFVRSTVGADRLRRDVDNIIREDPRSATGHALRAELLSTYDWDWAAAQREADLSVSLAKNNSFALYAAGDIASVLGRWEQAETLFRQALAVDPLDADTHNVFSWVLFHAGRFAEAEVEGRRVLEIRPSFASGHFALGLYLLAQGKSQAALSEIQQEEIEGFRSAALAMAFHALRRKADSDAALRRAERDSAQDVAYEIACAHAFRGEVDAAFQWLDRAYVQKDYLLEDIKGEWALKSLESDPRYKAFLRKMNLPE